MFRTLIFFLLFWPMTAFVSLTGILVSLLSPDLFHSYSRLWAKASLLLAGVRLKVEGLELLPRDRPIILMANHQSNFDIFALQWALPIQFRFLAKAELFRIPLVGIAMSRIGHIPVDRSDRRKAMHSMIAAGKKISAGTSAVIFPEGTRSSQGELLPFKKGGFLLALQAAVPMFPVSIDGSHSIMPKGTRRIYGGTIHLHIHPPVETTGLDRHACAELMKQVRTPIEQALSRSIS